MGLPTARVLTSLMLARRAIPLVADHDAVQVLSAKGKRRCVHVQPSAVRRVDVGEQVVYEDDDLVAVNKPAGITTTPVHRFQVSMALHGHRAVHAPARP